MMFMFIVHGDTHVLILMCGGWMVLVTGDRPSLGRPTDLIVSTRR